MSRIKIVHVQVAAKMSGAQLFSLNLLSSLSDEKYEKYIIFSDSDLVSNEQKSEVIKKFTEANVHIIWMSSLKRIIGFHDIRCFVDFYSLFRRYKFDIVHTNSTKPGIVARVAARLAGIRRVIHTVHGIAYHQNIPLLKRYFYYCIEVFATPFSHFNVCVNKFYLKYYTWIPFCKSLTIYNGLDFSTFPLVYHAEFYGGSNIGDSSRTIQLLFVGRLDEQKDPLTTLKAFNMLVSKYTSVNNQYVLSVVGDGEYLDSCKKYCAEHDLQKLVTFHGWSTDTALHYKNADVFISSSIYEAFGFTLIEAAYFGLPIVATNVEGIPEVVLNNKMGLLVEPKNPILFAEAIFELTSNKSRMQSYSDFSRRSVMSRFQLTDMVNAYRVIYEG